MKINIKYFYLKVWSCVTYCVTLIHQTKTNAMNGINSHTHDYIAIGGYKEEEITLKSCELCAERFWTDSLNPFKDYDLVCDECIRLTEQEDSENALYERGVTDGRIELAQQILNESPADTMTKADLIKIISKLLASKNQIIAAQEMQIVDWEARFNNIITVKNAEIKQEKKRGNKKFIKGAIIGAIIALLIG